MNLDQKLSNKTFLTCKEALEISNEINANPKIVGEKATSKSIKITDCEFGEFGKFNALNSTQNSIEIFEAIKPYIDIHQRINCEKLLEISKIYSTQSIRSCLKEFDIKVKNCSLGLFREKSEKKLFLKVKTWVENENGKVVFSKENNESLDMIAKSGSIKRASEILDINYKKCWTHLKIFEKSMGEKIALSRRGTGDDSGTRINKKALSWIDKYKKFQKSVDEFANKEFERIFFDEK